MWCTFCAKSCFQSNQQFPIHIFDFQIKFCLSNLVIKIEKSIIYLKKMCFYLNEHGIDRNILTRV